MQAQYFKTIQWENIIEGKLNYKNNWGLGKKTKWQQRHDNGYSDNWRNCNDASKQESNSVSLEGGVHEKEGRKL